LPKLVLFLRLFHHFITLNLKVKKSMNSGTVVTRFSEFLKG